MYIYIYTHTCSRPPYDPPYIYIYMYTHACIRSVCFHTDMQVTCMHTTAWSVVLQSTLNARTHALNGNTVLRLAFQEGVITGRIGLSLEDCIPTPALPTYPRDWLLKARCNTQDPVGNYPPIKHIQTTPLPFTHKPQCSKRSGRRVRYHPRGKIFFF